MIRIPTFVCLLSVLLSTAALEAQNLHQWLIPLRDAVYEHQLSVNRIVPLYDAAKAASRRNLSGTALDLALSRCELLMGRAYLFEERHNEARARLSEGLKIAENAVQTASNDEAWVLRAENLSYICQISPVSFVIANGLKVEEYAKKALQYNSRNANAQYLIAARWVYAPAPFHNHRKGIEMMTAIINSCDMERDDRFNVYYAIGYAYIQQNRNADAGIWLQRALEVYPTNKYAKELLNGIKG